MLKLTIPVEPMWAVRMTGRGKYIKPNAQRYLAYKDQIKGLAKQQLKDRKLLTGALEVGILFTMPILKSWSNVKKQQAVGEYHTKKPDTDNLVKGVFDSLNKLVWQDDNQVAKVIAVKSYGEVTGMEIVIKELE
ncbi:RusA family crossover junction endodeoxyribonuclease [Metabacillus fastidiosus]|uniref:RusA family crossover junction endodeoxyribonuclease n=1 Tax=Metabacillus fastidiosus TaxID=1458 RepID=UPI002E1EA75C|nr:RusA family crossover junction endodeoxyribonuclease [Metabacillus fastidiosus]